MRWTTLPYLLPYFVSLIISCGVWLYTFRRREVAGALPFSVMILSEAFWTLGYIFELVSPSLEAKILWDNVQLLGMFVLELALLTFALEYTGRRLPHPRLVWPLLVLVPLSGLILAFTYQQHGLVRQTAYLVDSPPFSALIYDLTMLDWVMYGYGYALIGPALALLFAHFVNHRGLYRFQTGVILAGLMIPLAGSVLSLSGVMLTAQRDTTPLTFALANLVFAWGLFRYGLLDVVPVAADTIVDSIRDIVVVIDSKNRIIDVNPAAQTALGRSASEIVGLPARQVYQQWADMVVRLWEAEQASEIISAVTESGLRHYHLMLSSLYDSRDRLAARVVVLRDVTDRVEAQKAEHEQRVLAEALIDVAAALNSSLEFDMLVERILDNVGRVVPHTWAEVIFIRNGLSRIVRGQAVESQPEEKVLEWSIESFFPLRQMVETRQPCLIAHTAQEPAWAKIPVIRWALSYLGVPLIVGGEVAGFINLASTEPGFFTSDHRYRLQAFADQVSVALYNVYLHEQAQIAAAETERQKLARDLHDSVSQTLFAANSIAELLPRAMATRPEKVDSYIQELVQLTRGAMAEMRSLMVELRPEALAQIELGVLLKQLCDAFTGNTQIPVAFSADDRYFLKGPSQVAFYRIAQEALRNIMAHARAQKVAVRLSRFGQDRVELIVTDDGHGFDPSQTFNQKQGLRMMRDHAQSAGAELIIASTPGKGTVITLRGRLA